MGRLKIEIPSPRDANSHVLGQDFWEENQCPLKASLGGFEEEWVRTFGGSELWD